MSGVEKDLTEAERLRQIGSLLYRAIDWSKIPVSPDEPKPAPTTSGVGEGSAALAIPETRVMNYLRRVGEASPAVLRTVLHMPKTSAYRVIQGMVAAGSILGCGQTRSLVYRLPPHGQNVEGN